VSAREIIVAVRSEKQYTKIIIIGSDTNTNQILN
jgi:hypothetical protein